MGGGYAANAAAGVMEFSCTARMEQLCTKMEVMVGDEVYFVQSRPALLGALGQMRETVEEMRRLSQWHGVHMERSKSSPDAYGPAPPRAQRLSQGPKRLARPSSGEAVGVPFRSGKGTASPAALPPRTPPSLSCGADGRACRSSGVASGVPGRYS